MDLIRKIHIFWRGGGVKRPVMWRQTSSQTDHTKRPGKRRQKQN